MLKPCACKFSEAQATNPTVLSHLSLHREPVHHFNALEAPCSIPLVPLRPSRQNISHILRGTQSLASCPYSNVLQVIACDIELSVPGRQFSCELYVCSTQYHSMVKLNANAGASCAGFPRVLSLSDIPLGGQSF